MGYGDEFSLTAKSHDGGIDGIVNEDALGLDKIYLQAKRYADNKVNGKEMRDFLGGITDKKPAAAFLLQPVILTKPPKTLPPATTLL